MENTQIFDKFNMRVVPGIKMDTVNNNPFPFLLQEIKAKMHVSEYITIHYCERTMLSDITSSVIATNGWKETKMARKLARETEGEAQAGVSVVGMLSLDR